MSTWVPLEELGEQEPLRLFKQGLECLARDQFAEARRLLEEGISRNRENPPLNRDMRMVLDRVATLGDGAAPGGETSPPSDAHFLVSNYQKPS